MDYHAIVSQVVMSLLLVAIPAIGGYIATFLHAHIKQSVLDRGVGIARIAVAATEQMAKQGHLEPQQKYNIALTQARAFATRFGVNFTDSEWQSLIEHAVAEVNAVVGQIAEPLPAQQALPYVYNIPSFTTPNPLATQIIHAGDPPGTLVNTAVTHGDH